MSDTPNHPDSKPSSSADAESRRSSSRPTASRVPRIVLAFFLGLSLLLITGFSCFYYFIAKPMQQTATAPIDRLASAMSQIFATTVSVAGESAVLEQSEIGELALIQREISSITRYQTRWMGSKKTLIVRANFTVKAGFDLSEGGQWGIITSSGAASSVANTATNSVNTGYHIDGALPKGEILSVEPSGDFEIYHADNGTLNKLSSQDHAEAFNLLKAQARRDAEASDAPAAAEALLRQRLADLLGSDYNHHQQELIP